MWRVSAGAGGGRDHAVGQLVRARGAVVVDDRLERFDPLLRLGGVGIVVEDFVKPVHRGALRRGPLAAQWSWNKTFHSIRGALARADIQRSARSAMAGIGRRDRKSTRLKSSHSCASRMPSSA